MKLVGDLGTSSTEVTEYVDAWLGYHARSSGKEQHELTPAETRTAARDLCNHLYDNLTILDSKAAGLISANALMTGILSILAFTLPADQTAAAFSEVARFTALILLPVSLLSLGINASVLYVFWSNAKEIAGLVQPTDRARMLFRIRNERTKRYKIAFWMHLSVIFVGFLTLLGTAAGALF